MAKSTRLGDGELEVMQAIWEAKEPVSAGSILEKVKEKRTWGLSTLITVLGRLIEKGYLSVDKTGGTNIYTPIVSEKDYAHISKTERAEMPVKPAETRKKSFDEVINGFSEGQTLLEAKRCLECGCHDYSDCKLIRYANENCIDMRKIKGVKHSCFTDRKLVSIERDMGKCMLCGLCVRVCEEKIGKGLLGFNGRGFKTAIKPEFSESGEIVNCKNCLECAKICPTGALKILE